MLQEVPRTEMASLQVWLIAIESKSSDAYQGQGPQRNHGEKSVAKLAWILGVGVVRI